MLPQPSECCNQLQVSAAALLQLVKWKQRRNDLMLLHRTHGAATPWRWVLAPLLHEQLRWYWSVLVDKRCLQEDQFMFMHPAPASTLTLLLPSTQQRVVMEMSLLQFEST